MDVNRDREWQGRERANDESGVANLPNQRGYPSEMGVTRGAIIQSEHLSRAPHGIIFLAPPIRLQRLFPVPRRGHWAGLLPRWTNLSSNGEP